MHGAARNNPLGPAVLESPSKLRRPLTGEFAHGSFEGEQGRLGKPAVLSVSAVLSLETLKLALQTTLSQSRPCHPAGRTENGATSAKPMGALQLTGITGENSHYTNQSAKMKIDRVLTNIFYLSTDSR
jgi:hypothetical protein